MRVPHTRKTPHFFVVNPTRDRRHEQRFDTKEPTDIRSLDTKETAPGLALEIERTGLRFQSPHLFDAGTRVQLSFPKTPDNTGCFGRVAWVRPNDGGPGFLCGVAVESWYGVVKGAESWKRLKGVRPKADRRNEQR